MCWPGFSSKRQRESLSKPGSAVQCTDDDLGVELRASETGVRVLVGEKRVYLSAPSDSERVAIGVVESDERQILAGGDRRGAAGKRVGVADDFAVFPSGARMSEPMIGVAPLARVSAIYLRRYQPHVGIICFVSCGILASAGFLAEAGERGRGWVGRCGRSETSRRRPLS